METADNDEPSIPQWIAVSAMPALLTIGFGGFAVIRSGGLAEIIIMVPFGLARFYHDLGLPQRAAITLMVVSYISYAIIALVATFAFSIRLKLILCGVLLSIACANLYGCQRMATDFFKISKAPNHAMQLTASARHAGCCPPADPPTAGAPRSGGS